MSRVVLAGAVAALLLGLQELPGPSPSPDEEATPGPGPRPTPPPPAELTGLVEVKGADGALRPGAGTVVWVPGAPATAAARPTMTSKDKRFEPHVLAVSRGTSVVFPNVDKIFHNVFSLSQGNAFDLGLYRKGASRATRFDTPGLVSVYCNIHPDMAGFVMVLDGAAFAVAGEDGRYRIAGIPAGRRSVRVWHERGGEREVAADFVAGGRRTLDFQLDATRYRRIQHKNKYGKDYPPVTRDDDRY
jgi:plastocyanin